MRREQLRTGARQGAGVMLAAATLFGPVAAAHTGIGDCSYAFTGDEETLGWLPAPHEPVEHGDRVCGDENTNLINTMSDGEFEGAGGYDRIVKMSGGTFDGGGGGDHVLYMSGGAFVGGDGHDVVAELSDGTFDGGDGRDHVLDLDGGEFDGGDGEDTVNLLYGGTFTGGDGDDTAILMYGGAFEGGEGFDKVLGYCDGVLLDVEAVTPLADCP